jgi:nucleotide-binding universal stress UspA family protein
MYSDVIVPLDGSDAAARAIWAAATIAGESDAELTLTSVVTPAFATALAERLRGQAAAADVADASISLLVSGHPPAEHLLQSLKQRQDHLLCMATTGRSHLGQVVGSVADHLLRFATGPFLLVGPACDIHRFKASGPMVVAVDGSSTGDEILPIAGAWAEGLNLEPVAATVVEPTMTETLATLGAEAGAETSLPREAARQLEGSTGMAAQWEVLSGAPAEALVRFADDIDASMIAMTTHGRTGLARLLMGSVAMEVVHLARCPVLVHRPLRLRA